MTVLQRSELDLLHFPSEADLEPVVERYLRDHGYTRIGWEVGFYDMRVDLYGRSTRGHRTVAVELKLTKWRRAFVQALQYQLCADRAYVALPAHVVPRVDVELFKTHGIGLLAVTRYSCVEVVSATARGVMRADYRDRMLDQLRERQHGRVLT